MFVPFACESGEVVRTVAALVMVMPISGRETTRELLIGRGVATIKKQRARDGDGIRSR
jgi:hypothetical protein